MFDFIYTGFFLALVAEALLFAFLTLPTPRGWKGKVVNFLNTSKSVHALRKMHLMFCLIALIFLFQAYSNQEKFSHEKHEAKKGDSIAAGRQGLT